MVSQTAWWNYLGVTNILSEGGIIGQALLVIVRIQTDFNRKVGVFSVFLIRVVYVMNSTSLSRSLLLTAIVFAALLSRLSANLLMPVALYPLLIQPLIPGPS
jgi:hypothetical protein